MRLRMRKMLPILIGVSVISLTISFLLLHRLISEALFSSLEQFELQQLADRAKEMAAAHRVAKVLDLPRGVNVTLVPVFVIEEHYEVLKHWFDAVKAGVIPATGNTLLHIDGHSDGAIPHDLSIVPHFCLPKNRFEVYSMMQGNDIFISAAALAGLIKRFIWVWPAWDNESHINETDHEVFDVRVGLRTFYPRKGDPEQRFCACSRSQTQGKDGGSEDEEWECWDRDSASIEPNEGPTIASDSCTIQLTGSIEFVSEAKAVELLQAGGWITDKDQLLLDIDEDFYGCESSVTPLYNAGVNQSSIDFLSDLINKLLCVMTGEQERLADSFFHTVIQTILHLKISACKSDSTRPPCFNDFEMDKALIDQIPDFLGSLRNGTDKGLLCSEDEKSNGILMQVILRLLENLEVVKLRALGYVGLCWVTAPTNYYFNEENALHICHGYNTPNDTQVTFHIPTERENEERTNLLQKILTFLPRQPVAITVCRSMRDGYTPWRYFRQIENAIFSTLENIFADVHRAKSFHFDDYLLGGKKGWPERHR